MQQTIVVAGAGHAAGQLIASLKLRKFAGRIVLLGDEPHLPYQRPPLSKKYLAGVIPAARLAVKPAGFYEDPRIEVHLGRRAERIDRSERQLVCDTGPAIAYDKLVLATGSRARSLAVPGHDLEGVHYLRTIDDVDAIRAELGRAQKAVIVGAGYIGLEVAAVCRQLGLQVTVIEMADRVMSRVVSPEVSDFYAAAHERHGVELLLSTGLAGFHGDGHVESVECADGRRLHADFVVIGAGILPNTELALDAGLAVDNGIAVDARCRTSDARIFAVGDCSSHPSAVYGRRVRLESVHNALEQAKTAAANLCGEAVSYDEVPWFWSDQYELKLQIAGLSEGYDRTILRGDPAAAGFSCLYLRDERLIAVDAVNAPRDFIDAKALIAAHAVIDCERLADSGSRLKDLV